MSKEEMMKRIYITGGIILIALATTDFIGLAYANSNNSVPGTGGDISIGATNTNQNFSKSNSTGGQATASVGDTSATGGRAEGGEASNALTINDTQPRQAPGVYSTQQQSTTAGLKCFGWGGSIAQDNHAAGTTFGWCWLQRDAWALQRSQRLEQEGFTEASVTAYCSQKILARDYGGKAECRAARTQMYIDREIEANELIMLEQRANAAENRARELESLLDDFTRGGKTAKKSQRGY